MITMRFLHFRLKPIELIKKVYLNLIVSDVNLFILALLEQCRFLISKNISRLFLLCRPTNFMIALETI